MTNIDIRFSGTGNFSQVNSQLVALEKHFTRLQAQMQALSSTDWVNRQAVNPQQHRTAMRAVQGMGQVYADAAASTGLFEVTQHKVNSQTQEYTKLLQKQKLGMRDMITNQKILRSAYHEQLRLQRAYISSWNTNAAGQTMATVTVPKTLPAELDNIRNKLGYISAVTASASQQMINWGKNTQWAGRQLMVGFTMPLLAFGAATGVLAYQVDKEMTRIKKVYDTQADANTNLAAVNQELAQLEADSWATAAAAAEKYGASIQETLGIAAELAATGLTGSDLQAGTEQIMRISKLGDFAPETAMKTYIALTSILGSTAEEAADQFNYMNAIENATSLATEDFAKAIPIALGPMKEMGGGLEDLALLLVAMKERGIEAGEGANAIKSMMQRLYRPSVQIRSEWQELAGIDLTEMVRGANGNVMEILPQISEAVADLSRPERVQLLGGLFGTYQVARQNAILKGLDAMNDKVGQTNRVLQVNEAGWKSWQKTADQELARWADSASGKFQIAWNTLKVNLAEMGRPFLEVGAEFMMFVTNLVQWFNDLPGAAKKGMAAVAVFTAILGPVVMLTGLFMNMTGTIAKVFGSLGLLATRFQLVTKEQKIAQVATDWATSSTMKQTSAIEQQTVMLTALSRSIDAATASQRNFAISQRNAAMLMGMPQRGAQGNPLLGPPLVLPPHLQAGYKPAPDPARTGQAITDTGEKASRSWGKTAGYIGTAALGMSVMALAGDNVIGTIGQIAMWAAIIAPTFAMLAPAAAAAGSAIWTKVVAGLFAANVQAALLWRNLVKMGPAGIVGAIGRGMAGAATSAAAFMTTTAGLGVVLAAAGVGVYAMYKNLKGAADEVKNIYGDAEGLSKILGYTPTEQATVVGPGGEVTESELDKVAEFRKEYGAVVDSIKDANGEQNKFNAAMTQGLKVISSGGTAEQAREAVLLALEAAGEEAKDYSVEFKAQLDFTNVDNVINQWVTRGQTALNDAFSRAHNYGFTETFNIGARSLVPGLDNEVLSEQSKEAGLEAGRSFASGFMQAQTPAQNATIVEGLYEQLSRIPEGDLRAEVVRGFVEALGGSLSEFDEAEASLTQILDAAGMLTSENHQTLLELQAQNGEIGWLDNVLLGVYNTQDQINKISRNTTDEYVAQTSELTRQASKLATIRQVFKDTDWTENLKNVMSETTGDVADAMTADFESEFEGMMDRMEANHEARLNEFEAERTRMEREHEVATESMSRRHEREQRQFDNRWENRIEDVSGTYDRRVKGIERQIAAQEKQIKIEERQIAAEERAEEIRQRIFDAEIARIQHLSDLANQNIDFNMALNAGDLDEAAKIRNDMEATIAENQLERAGARDSGGRADPTADNQRRIDRLQNTIDKIEEQKQARLDALNELQEAEKRSLEKRQAQEERAMERSQEREQRHLERSQERYERWYENQRDMREKWIEGEKEKWRKAMDALNSYIPTSEKDLRRHIKNVGDEYQVFGGYLERNGDRWATIIGRELKSNVRDAAQSLRSDINWAGIAVKSAKAWANALGISFADFKKMMGITFSAKEDINKKRPRVPYKPGDQPATSLHTGGPVWDGRTGYPRGAAPFPSEHLRLLKNDEYVVDGRTHRKMGTSFFDGLKQQAQMSHHDGGAVGMPLGMAGMATAVFAKTVENAIGKGVQRAVATATTGGYTAAKPGVYGASGIHYGPEQLANAAIIASVGQNMGMSKRDIMIGIMTAITESGLVNVNYGDRDSLGLFQQRPSQGWGSAAQVTDPIYASRKFFQGLRGIENRDTMAPWMAAQSVQRSAYADGSNYRIYLDEARDIINSMRMTIAGGMLAGRFMANPGQKVYMDGEPLTGIVKAQLLLAEKLSGQNISVMQGQFQPATSYSGTSHMGAGGGVDTSPGTFNQQYWLRRVGFAAWARNIPGAAWAGSGAHIHGVSLLNPASRGHSQIASYRAGGDGLGGRDYGPAPGILPNLQDLLPHAANGATMRWDGPVFAHKGEHILTEELSRELDRGIRNFANGATTVYNNEIRVYAAEGMDENALADAVIKKMERKAGLTGRNRKVEPR